MSVDGTQMAVCIELGVGMRCSGLRTPVGAQNSVVGADEGLCAPSWDQESVRDSGHEDSASASIAAGQRPRLSLRHPQAVGDVRIAERLVLRQEDGALLLIGRLRERMLFARAREATLIRIVRVAPLSGRALLSSCPLPPS